MTALTTLATLKAELGITGSSDDTRLARLITQVSAQIETFLGRRLERRTLTELFYPAGRVIQLSAWPITALTSVTDGDTIMTEDDYLLDPEEGMIFPPVYGVGFGSPCGYRRWWTSVSVVYTGGYLLPGDEDADLPGDIERACLDLAIRYHHAGGRDPTLRSETVPGVIEQSWSAVDSIPTIGGLPFDIAKSLTGYKRAVL